MRRSVILLAAAATATVVIALVVALGLGLRAITADQVTVRASVGAQDLVTLVGTAGDRAEVVQALAAFEDSVGGIHASVLYPDGSLAQGPAARSSGYVLSANPAVRRVRAEGSAGVLDTDLGRELVLPVFTSAGTPSVVHVVVPPERLHQGLGTAYAVLAVLAFALVGLATLAADRLGRSFVEPVASVADAARALAAGRLKTRVTPSGPPEVQAVGHGLNTLADRIEELLERERERAADLAHRLRTPLTALRLTTESVHDDVERARLTDVLTSLESTVDTVIREARNPSGAVVRRCDAAEVTRERAAFWAVLAEEEGRRMTVVVPSGDAPVPTTREDLVDALDAVLGNVFSHTPEGVAVEVSLRHVSGRVAVVVSDEGPGIEAGSDPVERGQSGAGSTGLGLGIATRVAEEAGGRLDIEASPRGGTRVTIELPVGADEVQPPRRDDQP